MARKYTAFISYRHKPLDIQVAQKLHTLIERYRIPRALRKAGRKNMGLVFRDRDELPLSNNLTGDIYEALDNSEFLIVVCTPDTPKSLWCLREIQYFISRHGRERILTVLAAGTPEESIPDIITTVYAQDGKTVLEQVEPLCAFLVDETPKKVLKNLKEEFLRLAAAILDCPYDALKQRQKRYRARRRMAVFAAVTAVLLTIFGLLIRWNLDMTQKNEEITQKNQEISSLNDRILDQLRQSQLNESQALSLLSQAQLGSGLRGSALESALAALEGDRPYYAPAEAALTDALHAYDGDKYYYAAQLQLDTHVDQVILSRDGQYAIALDDNRNGTCVELQTGKTLWENLPLNMSWRVSAISEDNSKLIALSQSNITEYSVQTGQELRILQHTPCSIQMLSPDTNTLVFSYKPSAYRDPMTFQVMDVATGQILHTIPLEISFRDIIFSHDSRYCLLIPYYPESTPLILDCREGRIYEAPLQGDLIAACAVPDVCFAFLSKSSTGQFAYQIFAPQGILLRTLPAGSYLASQVQYLLADDQWIYCVRQDGGIQIVHQHSGVMFDDSYVKENTLVSTADPMGMPDYPAVFLDSQGTLVVVNREDAISRLYFSERPWHAVSLGVLHDYMIAGVASSQLCRADAYGEIMEYGKAFINPQGSSAICLADKDDDSHLIFLRYAAKQAEDVSHLVPNGCTEANTRAYLQDTYSQQQAPYMDFDDDTSTLSWGDTKDTATQVACPYLVTNPFGPQVYYGHSGLITLLSRKSSDPDSKTGFAVYHTREDRWKWFAYSDSPACVSVGSKNPWLATVSDSGRVLQVMDFASGQVIASLELHSGDVSDLQFICDDRYILAAETLEQSVILVDTATWQVLGKYATTLTDYSFAADYASAALSADGKRLYIGNLLALQRGLIIDTESWTLLATVPYMACYDPETDRILCMDPVNSKLIAWPVYSTEALIQAAKTGHSG